jgi:hypothetical protein
MSDTTTGAGLNLASKLFEVAEKEFEKHSVALDYESRERFYSLITHRTGGLPEKRSSEMAPGDPFKKDVEMAEVAVKLFALAAISYVGIGGSLKTTNFIEIKRLLCPLFPFFCDPDE